jgi:DNA-binding NarL/FixJ family response regulator
MKTTRIHYTSRELEIIKMILLTDSRKFIAESLGISVETVNAHIRNILKKTSWHSVTELIVFLLTSDFSLNPDRTEVLYLGRVI